VTELDRQPAITAAFESEGTFTDVPSDAQLVVYRVAQEALSNASRHAGAEHVWVRLARAGDFIELSVSDDGRGFTFDQAGSGLGLGGMRERALLVGGDLRIESRPQVGTRVRLNVPIRKDDERNNAGTGTNGGVRTEAGG
jgi:two-component system sensor histidine kinase UhpB